MECTVLLVTVPEGSLSCSWTAFIPQFQCMMLPVSWRISLCTGCPACRLIKHCSAAAVVRHFLECLVAAVYS